MKNYYETLEVNKNASIDEIKRSFRKLAKKYHPDTNVNDKTLTSKFQEINEAYAILKDDNSRKEYDKKLKEQNINFNKSNSRSKSKSKTKTYKNSDMKSAMDNLNKSFENFFGFDANTNDINKETLNNKGKNPIDTSHIFNSFFKLKNN